MINLIKFNAIFFIFLLLGTGLGWCLNELYDIWSAKRIVDGLAFYSPQNHTDALQVARQYDQNGIWVCINVKGMPFSRANETCIHECAHATYSEILANYCEKNPNECGEFFDKIDGGEG